MRATLSALFGLAAYAIAVGTMGYLAGFSAGVGVPKGVDDGLAGPGAVAVDVGLLALFGLQHSLMARRGFKAFTRRWVPAELERSAYLVATSAALLLLVLAWQPVSAPVIWAVQTPWAVGLVWALCALGWGLALWSTFLLDHAELFGLRQSLNRPSSAPPTLRTPGLYRWVRHPLYLGMLLGLWAAPRMTAGHALYAGGLTVYVLIGMAFEERDLVQQFGEAYRRYRQQAGALLPRWRR